MNEAVPSIFSLLIFSFGLGLMAFALVAITSFVKITIVLFLVRNAIGAQHVPPNIVLYVVALILSAYLAAPLISQVISIANAPNARYQTFNDWSSFAERAREPVKAHLMRYTSPEQRQFFYAATARVWPAEMVQQTKPDDLTTLVPAFLASELKRAFEIGFLLYLPFIVIDLVVTTILMAMGMSMVSPTTITTPLKIFLFIAVDGWSRLLHGLVLSYA
jgi:type III secretion protein R